MYKKILLLGFMTSTGLGLCHAAKAETLRESVMMALNAHPSVEAAMAKKEIAEQTRKEARSDLFPYVTAGTNFGILYGNNSTSRGLTVSRGAANSGLWEANASVTQPIFDGMQTFNRMDAASSRMQSADYNVLDVRENLALKATQAHIAVLQAQATYDRTNTYFAAIEDYLSRIDMMVSEGAADSSEAAQARNISLMLKSTLTDYEGQLQSAIANYNEIVGNAPKSALIKPSNVNSLSQNADAAIQYTLANHPLLKANEKELDAINYEVKAEKGTIFPELNAEVSGLKRDQKEEIGGELEDARAALKLSWDFETGGASKARVKKSKAQYSQILAQNAEQVRTIEGDVNRAYAELMTAEKQMDLVKSREVVTGELFDAYKTQFEGARVRLLQLMQAENQLFNSQLESIAAEYRYLFAQYNVLASMGQLQNVIAGDTSTMAMVSQTVTSKMEEPVLETVSADEKIQEPLSKELDERIYISK